MTVAIALGELGALAAGAFALASGPLAFFGSLLDDIAKKQLPGLRES